MKIARVKVNTSASKRGALVQFGVPEEWVSVASLRRYRLALGDFVRGLPGMLERGQAGPDLRSVEGGLA